jgi:hypothetical protein
MNAWQSEMEDAMKQVSRESSETRELSDKELGKIISAMGDSIRSQSLHVASIIQANLAAEFAARRKITPPVKILLNE